ncbi:hypothetical protein HOLleu_34047 [Holothuria leucospilota]|uniref:Uncharacterized protein n=1 Tax=Holothuria leucospilota TaxID=206669 RepID=A0A9Q1BI32_HOLLE|nr:hypothetical protein HOLleu_34047 [Holothuria leucospilota]
MMHSMLKVALVVFSVALTFFNQCSTGGTALLDFSLEDEINEEMEAVRQMQEIIPEIECSQFIKGLQHLKKQTKCCKNTKRSQKEDSTCIGKNKFDICLYGIDVAVRYVPFFVEESKKYPDDTVIQNLSSNLQNFNMTFRDRLGRCIRPIENDCKSYELSNATDTECDTKSLVLEGMKDWTVKVIDLYDELNSTVNESSQSKLESRCKKEIKREIKRKRRELKKKERDQRQEKKNKRKRERDEKRRLKGQRQVDQQNDPMMTSSPPDCI